MLSKSGTVTSQRYTVPIGLRGGGGGNGVENDTNLTVDFTVNLGFKTSEKRFQLEGSKKGASF